MGLGNNLSFYQVYAMIDTIVNQATGNIHMGNLIKPVDYASEMGISRQAVYAKIKKGILTSRNIGGKIFIVTDKSGDSNSSSSSTSKVSNKENTNATIASSDQSQEKLLKAKDETISILKETIVDLKDTNKMITSTLRSEVELLKDAFGEMKMLYGLQLEHKKQNETKVEAEEHSIVVDTVDMEEEPEEWIGMGDFFALHDIKKDKKQKKIKKYLKECLKKGDTRIDRFDGEMVFLANAEFEDVLKKPKWR